MLSVQRIHIENYNDNENYHRYLQFIEETKRREKVHNIDICVTYIFENNNSNIPLLITHIHPSTYLFLLMLLQICQTLQLPYLNKEQFDYFIQNLNHMELP